jgi:hypothetical protein
MKLVMQCYPIRSKSHEARYTMHSSSCYYLLTPTNPPLNPAVEHLQVLPGDQTAYPHKSGKTAVLDILYFQTANGKTKDSEHNDSKRSSNSFPNAQILICEYRSHISGVRLTFKLINVHLCFLTFCLQNMNVYLVLSAFTSRPVYFLAPSLLY